MLLKIKFMIVQIWAFEAIPGVGKKFGRVTVDSRIPRMISWEMSKQLRGETLCTFFESSNVSFIYQNVNGVSIIIIKQFAE
jgi:hypothetical protein